MGVASIEARAVKSRDVDTVASGWWSVHFRQKGLLERVERIAVFACVQPGRIATNVHMHVRLPRKP